MAVKKRGLGRGLDALLSGPTVSSLEEQAVQADQRELQHLPLDLISAASTSRVGTWTRKRWKNWRSRSRPRA